MKVIKIYFSMHISFSDMAWFSVYIQVRKWAFDWSLRYFWQPRIHRVEYP